VLGQSVLVNQNVANAAGGDVRIGYIDPTVPGAPFQTAPAFEPLYDSVQVVAQRSASHTGLVPTFFASLMGFRGGSVAVPSTATAQPYQITGFQTVGSQNANRV
jgi:hypothetical protein